MTRKRKYAHLIDATEKERASTYYQEYRNRWPERQLHRSAKNRAKVKGLEFNLDYEDIVIPEFCPILGIKLEGIIGTGQKGGRMASPSLDKIDNTKGYVKGNVQVISHKANSMKFTATPEELKLFADWIKRTYD